MAVIVIPVLLSFFLGPGMGQIYNKEYKKGILLIVASLILLAVAGVWYYHNLRTYIPEDMTTVDPQAMQQLMTNAANQIGQEQRTALALFQALLGVLWIYGIVDAYRVADKKRQLPNGRTPQ